MALVRRIGQIESLRPGAVTVTLTEFDDSILDPQGNPTPTGRSWSEPFDTMKKDWAELKERFRIRIQEDNAEKTAKEALTNALKVAGFENL